MELNRVTFVVLLIIFAMFEITLAMSSGGISSAFDKSTVIFNTCELKIHQTSSARSMEDCAVLCSQDSECRRFLFCSSSLLCQMYVDSGPCQASPGSSGCSCYSKKYSCSNSNCTCPLGYYGDTCQNIITDCSEADGIGIKYRYPVSLEIQPPGVSQPIRILCFAPSGGWTYVLSRNPECQFENFNRGLAEYETGFGTSPHNFWLGFDKLLILMAAPGYDYLLNLLTFQEGSYRACQSYYFSFAILKNGTMYKLQAGTYSPGSNTCGDSLSELNGNPFSTSDRDLTGTNKCGTKYQGGWWFNADSKSPECSRGFLFGAMNGSDTNNFWKDDLGDVKLTQIDIRIVRR